MRYDREIYFVKKGPRTYDKKSGNYEGRQIKKTKIMAAIMDTSAEMVVFVYGKLKQNSLTIHIQNHYKDSFDYIEIDNKHYAVDRMRRFRVKQSFIVSEM